jgi:dTDP-4-amino-4,6-dideoxygalactose transaminase
VPFLDLITPHRELEEELVDAVRRAVRSAAFIGGPEVEAFEREWADFCGVDHAVGVGSGTDALRFALLALGVGPGDAVVTVPNTFVATAEAILQTGAVLRLVDVEPGTWNMSAEALGQYLARSCDRKDGQVMERATGKRVRAIVPVHLYGQTSDMDRIGDVARDWGLAVVEDACQAHGSEYLSSGGGNGTGGGWRKAGSLGAAAAFSFYPGKNLGACGEAGAVTTADEEVASRIRMIRDHGQDAKYHHVLEGYNGRLDAIQAAMLRVKLPHLRGWNDSRARAAALYGELLSGIEGIEAPAEPDWSRGVHHLYTVQAADRAALQAFLGDRGVGTGLHYPIPVHLQPAYAHLGYRSGDFPVAERSAAHTLSLPMFPGITPEAQQLVAEGIRSFSETAMVAGRSRV